MCYIGDGNNMANSLIVGGLKSDMQVSIATRIITVWRRKCWIRSWQ